MRTIIPKNDIRFMYADWIAHIVCLELEGGATNIKEKSISLPFKIYSLINRDTNK
jgi:hypothetical protein